MLRALCETPQYQSASPPQTVRPLHPLPCASCTLHPSKAGCWPLVLPCRVRIRWGTCWGGGTKRTEDRKAQRNDEVTFSLATSPRTETILYRTCNTGTASLVEEHYSTTGVTPADSTECHNAKSRGSLPPTCPVLRACQTPAVSIWSRSRPCPRPPVGRPQPPSGCPGTQQSLHYQPIQ